MSLVRVKCYAKLNEEQMLMTQMSNKMVVVGVLKTISKSNRILAQDEMQSNDHKVNFHFMVYLNRGLASLSGICLEPLLTFK